MLQGPSESSSSVVCLNHILFLYLPANRRYVFFQLSAIVNKAAVNTCMQIFIESLLSVLSSPEPEGQVPGRTALLCFSVLRNRHTTFHHIRTVVHACQERPSAFQLSHILTNTSLFSSCPLTGQVVESHGSFDLHFPSDQSC